MSRKTKTATDEESEIPDLDTENDADTAYDGDKPGTEAIETDADGNRVRPLNEDEKDRKLTQDALKKKEEAAAGFGGAATPAQDAAGPLGNTVGERSGVPDPQMPEISPTADPPIRDPWNPGIPSDVAQPPDEVRDLAPPTPQRKTEPPADDDDDAPN